jgi:predicted flap endonuclease-1-like 5' DNA nuclease
MGYLLQQIFWYVLIAFLLGLLIGWWMARRAGTATIEDLERRNRALESKIEELNREKVDLEARLAESEREARSHRSGHDVETIEGIGSGFGRRLKSDGVHTVEQLLDLSVTDEGVERLRSITDTDAHTVYTWIIMADLMRIPGLGGQWAELLWRSGVTSVPDLATRDAADLLQHMKTVNTDEHRVHELPGEKRLRSFIEAAKTLPRLIPDREVLSG